MKEKAEFDQILEKIRALKPGDIVEIRTFHSYYYAKMMSQIMIDKVTKKCVFYHWVQGAEKGYYTMRSTHEWLAGCVAKIGDMLIPEKEGAK